MEPNFLSEIIREPEVTANFIPVGIVVISKENGKIVFVNNHAKELCGADPTNLEINNNLPKLIKLLTLGGDIYPFEKLPARKALSTGISITDELMIEHQDGSRIIVKVSANPIKNEKGEIIAAVAIFEDITTEKEVNRKVASLSKFPSENPNAVIRLTRHGVILYSNDAGYLLLRKWKTNVGEKAPKKLVSKINKTFLTKKVKAFEVDVGNKTFLLQMVPVIEEGYLNIYGTEITKRKKILENLKKKKRLLEAINNIFLEVLKTESEKALGKLCLDAALSLTNSKFGFLGEIRKDGFLHHIVISDEGWGSYKMKAKTEHTRPLGNFEIHSLYGKVLTDGKSFFTNNPNFQPERIRVPDGHPPLTSFLGVPMVSEGKTIGLLAVANRKDGYSKEEQETIEGLAPIIVEAILRNRAEKNLKKIKNDLDHAQNVGKIGSWHLDVQSNILMWSDENHRIFGITKGTPLTYETFLATIHPDDLDFVDKKWKAALRGKPYNIEHRIVVDGKIKWVWEKVDLEFDEKGNVKGGFGTTQDITEFVEIRDKLKHYREHLEELVEEKTEQLRDAERMAAIGETAGMIGHDIRNPLQSMDGALYLVKQYLQSLSDGSEEKKELIEIHEILQAQVAYINHMISDLQDFAKKAKPMFRKIDVPEILNESLEMVDVPDNIVVNLILPEDTIKIVSDPDDLKRILSNLFKNAIQAMPNGGELTILTYRKDDDVWIRVEDTGVGIPEEIKSKIFMPLFTTKSKGQGFGLAVAKKLTEAMDGSISCESEEGKGTTFTIKFPPHKGA